MTMRRGGLALALAGMLAGAAGLLSPAQPAHAYMRNRGAMYGGKTVVDSTDISVVENLGGKVPSGLVFTDGQGQPVSLDAYLSRGVPVVLTVGYFQCPMLCDLIHEGIVKTTKGSGLKPGKDFLGFAVSFDPGETAKSANTKQARLLRAIGHEQGADWPFVFEAGAPGAQPGEPARNVKALSQALGYKFKYDEKSKQFAHEAVSFVISPGGKISRYLYGVDFPSRDFRMAIVEAAEGRIGTITDRVLLTCFKYDPMTHRYTPFVFGFVRIGALASAAVLAGLLGILWRREIVLRRRRAA